MAKITLNNLSSLQNEASAINLINNNNDAIETAFENTLSRDGTTPNTMGALIDMDSHQIINLPAPSTYDSPLRFQDLVDFQGGGVVALPSDLFGTKADVQAAVIDTSVTALYTGGYTTAGDGGGALYKKSTTIPPHAGYITSADGAHWVIAEPIIYAAMLGVVMDFSTDNATAANNAAAVAAYLGVPLCFSPGIGLTSAQIDVSGVPEVYGAGMVGTTLASTSTTANLFYKNSVLPTKFYNLKIGSTVTKTAGIGIYAKGASDEVSRCQISGFLSLVKIDGNSYTIKDNYLVTPIVGGVGLFLCNTVCPDSGDGVVQGNTFDTSLASTAAIYMESGGGPKIFGNKILAHAYGLLMQPSSISTSVLLVNNNSFEGQTNFCIALSRTSGTGSWGRVQIRDNELGSYGGIVIAGTSLWVDQLDISGNQFTYDTFAISIDACNDVAIVGNTFWADTPNAPAITTAAALPTVCEIGKNFYQRTSTAFNNYNGNTNIIRDHDVSSLTNHGVLLGQGGAPLAASAAMTNGQLLVGQTSADPLPKTITGDWTISSAGVATLASTVTAGGPTGSATVTPIITYDAKGRLTTVSSATITPAIGSITGLGTGVATALAINIGTAGSPVINGGALGTPSSGVATNLTGTASGLTAGNVTTNANLTGVVTSVGNATSLGSFTSAALATALTDETGSGANVFGTSPILNTVDARGVWTAGATWTLPAHTLGGTVSGGGNQINNVIIGTSTPLAGSFTTLGASGVISSTNTTSGTTSSSAAITAKSIALTENAIVAGSAIFGWTANITALSAFVVGGFSKTQLPGSAAISLASNDAANQFQGALTLCGDASAANRRLLIQAVEQGAAFRNISLAESGGAVAIGVANGLVTSGYSLETGSGIKSAASILAHGGTAIPAGGTAGAGFLLSTTANYGIFFGSGAPTLSAAQGSLYLRSDGSSTSTRLYVNTNGSTTWTNVTTAL